MIYSGLQLADNGADSSCSCVFLSSLFFPVRVKTSHSIKPAMSVKVYICEECQKKYESSSGLRRHMAVKHPLQGTKQPIACRELQCTFTCRRLHALRNHLVGHGIKTTMETKTFDCIQGTFSSAYRNVYIIISKF